jgi:three-Cys-motif partner protein
VSGFLKGKVMRVESVGSWSIDKLDLLEHYLKPYAVIMDSQKRPTKHREAWLTDFYYIDAFAGPGAVAMKDDDATDLEAEDYLNGSPLRALECKPSFDHLWFIDKRESRRKSLTELLKKRGEAHRATVEIGDCNKSLDGIVSGVKNTERALAFLDPYGLQLDWSTVVKLAATKKLDVFINFSLMGVIRNLPRSDRPSKDVRGRLDRVMASSSWMDGIYHENPNMFGEIVVSRDQILASNLAALYAKDLDGIFGHVSNPLVMTNSKGSPLYALILASHQSVAKKIMNDIIAKHAARDPAPKTRRQRRPDQGSLGI